MPHDGTMQSTTWSPGLTVVTAGADRLDDSGALVTEDHRPAAVAELAVEQAQIGVAHAGGGEADEHLRRPGRREGDRLDAGPARLAQHIGADPAPGGRLSRLPLR